eukprot:TRINITY_DN4439_c0_g2_i1.p1 TRINITY_DN4439_c0_g2~~TRINITY_DN4439_c0_g2_i1.p1  ORF type:complete len:422 (+),score=113.81 TRINITY_DN4439_c0_g2_i1:1036-2301(+)
MYGQAVLDAEAAIAADPSYVKAYYRLGTAHFALGKNKEALKDFRTVVKLVPNDADAQRKLKEAEKAVKIAAFEAAIHTDREIETVASTIKLTDYPIESSYTGPHLPSTGITKEFMMEMIEHFKHQKVLPKRYAYEILLQARLLLRSLPTLVEISVKEGESVSVCGDVHGQFYDLVNIFNTNGYPSPTNPYLFNGDFVDRGSFSVEVIFTLLGFRLLYPQHFHMARGNHETRNMNKMYGFQGEVEHKYESKMFELFLDLFHALPLAHLINNSVFVVHGGLFKEDNVTLAQIKKIDRFSEPPEEGLMCDMLWSDPQPQNGRGPSKRGVGVSFGPDVTAAFLANNKLKMVVRSHEVKENGYEVEAGGKLVTVFSAPNYCDQIGNLGALIRFDSECNPTYITFKHVPHPPIRPMQYAMSWNMLGM